VSGLAEVELREAPARLFSTARQEAAPHQNGTEWRHHHQFSDGSTYLRWDDLFEFIISSDGRRVYGRSYTGASPEVFHTYVLGPVLSFSLVKQGIEPLHATAVVIDGGAVAFVGESGYGKSSLGAAFLQAGYPLLTDDLLVVTESHESFCVYTGPPRIKLFPEMASTFLGKDVRGTPMNHGTPKLIIPLGRRHCHPTPVPLHSVYVLTSGVTSKDVTIRSLSHRRAFLALVQSTFNSMVTRSERLQQQFHICAQMASRVPVKFLSYPRQLNVVPSVREAILADLRNDRGRP
jgi:hypothetical protein